MIYFLISSDAEHSRNNTKFFTKGADMKTDNMTEEQRADYYKEGAEKEHATSLFVSACAINTVRELKKACQRR